MNQATARQENEMRTAVGDFRGAVRGGSPLIPFPVAVNTGRQPQQQQQQRQVYSAAHLKQMAMSNSCGL